jgi:hypothetical protein
MKVLTIFSAIMLPLTFIAGVYGMNFDNMPELHSRYGYYAVWGLMIVVAFGDAAFLQTARVDWRFEQERGNAGKLITPDPRLSIHPSHRTRHPGSAALCRQTCHSPTFVLFQILESLFAGCVLADRFFSLHKFAPKKPQR